MHNNPIHLPPPLRRGDCIGLFSPSGPVREQEKLEAGIRILHDLGFKTYLSPAKETGHPYLADDDDHRVQEFHSMWRDSKIKAMMAVRGGYGCMRLMPHLDHNLIQQSPKMVIGFSDLTVMLNTLAVQLSTMAVHGPVLTSLSSLDAESLDSFVSLVSGNFYENKSFRGLEIVRGGRGTGVLRGGNLTTISHLLGTPWEVPFAGTLLFIEDTGEPMYKIDRMLTQLSISGHLEQLSGLLVGCFDCGADTNTNIRLQEDIWNRVLELTGNASFPVWGNVPVGHLSANHSLPIGMIAIQDSSFGTLMIDRNSH